VTGSQDGAVRFFDFQFRIVGWFEDIKQGGISSVSFSESSSPLTGASSVAPGALDDLDVPKFCIATSKGVILELDSKNMNDINVEVTYFPALPHSFPLHHCFFFSPFHFLFFALSIAYSHHQHCYCHTFHIISEPQGCPSCKGTRRGYCCPRRLPHQRQLRRCD